MKSIKEKSYNLKGIKFKSEKKKPCEEEVINELIDVILF